MKSSEIGPVPQTCPIPQTCLIILWRQISTWESKNKPDSIVMSNSPKHVWFGPTNVPDFTKKQHYPSILCMFTILSVFQCHKRVWFPKHFRLRHLPTNKSDFHHKRIWFGWRENVHHIDVII
jgi:hypothetical protein